MFNDLVESSVARKTTNKNWTVTLSVFLQGGLLFVFVLIPLMYTEALPKASLTMFLVAPLPPSAASPPRSGITKVRKSAGSIIQLGTMMSPTAIPKTINIIDEQEMPPDVSSGLQGPFGGGGSDGRSSGALTGIIGTTGPSALPPPPKPPQQRIRVGGNVQAARMLRQVQPIYSQIAKSSRIQGTVTLHAVIAKDGSVQELNYVSGPPLLMSSAMAAVRQWKYQATLLNGEPVEVETTISVVFTLAD